MSTFPTTLHLTRVRDLTVQAGFSQCRQRLGACIGAAIGLADRNQVLWIKPVMPTCKIEGIEVIRRANECEVLLVTDADDASVPAQLLSTTVELQSTTSIL